MQQAGFEKIIPQDSNATDFKDLEESYRRMISHNNNRLEYNIKLCMMYLQIGDFDKLKKEIYGVQSYAINEPKFLHFVSTINDFSSYIWRFFCQMKGRMERLKKCELEVHRKLEYFPLNIYIKAYSRPAYLARCVKSIVQWVDGVDKIIILNDGISPKYIGKIINISPKIIVRNSLKVKDGLFAMPKSGVSRKDDKSYDPAKFWAEEVGKDENPYVIVLEEDWWITSSLPARMLLQYMADNDVYTSGFQLHGERSGINGRGSHVKFFEIGQTEFEEYVPTPRNSLERASIFNIVNAIYQKEYFQVAYERNERWYGEDYAMTMACNLFSLSKRHGMPSRVIRMREGVIKHCVSSSTENYLLEGFDIYKFNFALSELWYHDRIDANEGMPNDFSPDYIRLVMGNIFSDEYINSWREYRKMFSEKYPVYSDNV